MDDMTPKGPGPFNGLIEIKIRRAPDCTDWIGKLPNGELVRLVTIGEKRVSFGGKEYTREQLNHYHAIGVVPERPKRIVSEPGEREEGEVWIVSEREMHYLKKKISGKTTTVAESEDRHDIIGLKKHMELVANK